MERKCEKTMSNSMKIIRESYFNNRATKSYDLVDCEDIPILMKKIPMLVDYCNYLSRENINCVLLQNNEDYIEALILYYSLYYSSIILLYIFNRF